MKEFKDFAAEIKRIASKNNFKLESLDGRYGAYQFSKCEIYESGYSLEGYTPAGGIQKTSLPKNIFLQNHFLQDKLFIILCKKIKTALLALNGDLQLMGEHKNLQSESGLVAILFLSGACGSGINEYLQRLRGNSGKMKIKGMPVKFYLERLGGYDLSSVKPD